jgi:hypothetical protein
VRRLFDCARLRDFASLADEQKSLNAARTKRKAEEQERAKKKVKRASAAKATRAQFVQYPQLPRRLIPLRKK